MNAFYQTPFHFHKIILTEKSVDSDLDNIQRIVYCCMLKPRIIPIFLNSISTTESVYFSIHIYLQFGIKYFS